MTCTCLNFTFRKLLKDSWSSISKTVIHISHHDIKRLPGFVSSTDKFSFQKLWKDSKSSISKTVYHISHPGLHDPWTQLTSQKNVRRIVFKVWDIISRRFLEETYVPVYYSGFLTTEENFF